MVNRLAHEASPYLVQHSRNPVDWYPWGSEALDRARRENRPILLSIGYSACHWCHVMERESFENEAIAREMNERFVCIKVDREERPDLDQIYQLVVQLMGRSGGWPLTVFLTPDQKPFFGGTYFPPMDRYGMPGFPKLLRAVHEAYVARRDEVDSTSAELTRAIAGMASGEARGPREAELSGSLLEDATRKLVDRFDDENGGFGSRPKFPNTMSLDVLLRGGEGVRVRRALDAMRAGGIWDHLGGGFHRYSTDERWLVPHFEKMLYDNALLLRSYTDGWRALGDEGYAETAKDIGRYLLREMQSPEGGLYATQDADSEGEEGRFFVWAPAEVDAACGDDAEASQAARRAWGVTPDGNFEDSNATVLSLVQPPRGDAEAQALERARRAMFDARERRPKPFRDEKVLASWNGLVIGALADAGAALDPALATAAERAMRFVESVLVVPEGAERARVLRLAKDGVAKGSGFLDDHAYVADAALDLYEATGDPHWVGLARKIARSIVTHFHDGSDEAFFFVPDDGEAILVRAKDPWDHAVPSAASVACRVLLRLGALVEPALGEIGTKAAERLARAAAGNPAGMSSAVCLGDWLVRGTTDVVIVGERGAQGTSALAREAFRARIANRVVAWVDPGDAATREACAVLAEGKTGVEGKSVAYVCAGRTCSLPIERPEELAEELRKG